MTSSFSPHPRQAVLQGERTLASIESQLRRATPKTLHVGFEALADAYIARPAGHRLDNLDRALLSYQLAIRFSSLTPSLSTKLGSACFLRLQTVSRDYLASPTLRLQHLNTARHYLDTAFHAFENDPALHLDPDSLTIYSDALFYRALVYDTLYQTIDADTEVDWRDNSGKLVREARAKRRVRRNHYITDCIESLEKVLAADAPSPEIRKPSHPDGQEQHTEITPPLQLHAVNKARAMMCLARAYSNAENAKNEGVSKAMMLLGSVENILDGVEEEFYSKGAVIGREELERMMGDARAQRAALAASIRASETRCVLC